MTYYIASHSGNVLGPYEEREIVDLVTAGLVNVEDKCTPEGREDWKPLGNVLPAVWSSPNAKLSPRRVGPGGVSGPSECLLLPTFLLWLLFGYIGIHNFYLGRWGLAIFQALLTILAIGNGLWVVAVLLYIVDGIFVIIGAKQDGQGRKVTKWT